MIKRVLKITDGDAEVYLLGDSEDIYYLEIDKDAVKDKDKKLYEKLCESLSEFNSSLDKNYDRLAPSMPCTERGAFLFWIIFKKEYEESKFDDLGVDWNFWCKPEKELLFGETTVVINGEEITLPPSSPTVY